MLLDINLTYVIVLYKANVPLLKDHIYGDSMDNFNIAILRMKPRKKSNTIYNNSDWACKN